MSHNKNFKAGLLVLTLLSVLSFRSNFARADDSTTPTAAASPAPSGEDGYMMTHLQPGTEISVPLHALVPSGQNISLGTVPGDDYLSCEVILSSSDQNREIDGTLFLTVTSTGCGELVDDQEDCTRLSGDYAAIEGINMNGESSFNDIPQSGNIVIRCDSAAMTIGQFKALIRQDGGTFKTPGPVTVQQL
jgi:hypothetical protein